MRDFRDFWFPYRTTNGRTNGRDKTLIHIPATNERKKPSMYETSDFLIEQQMGETKPWYTFQKQTGGTNPWCTKHIQNNWVIRDSFLVECLNGSCSGRVLILIEMLQHAAESYNSVGWSDTQFHFQDYGRSESCMRTQELASRLLRRHVPII